MYYAKYRRIITRLSRVAESTHARWEFIPFYVVHETVNKAFLFSVTLQSDQRTILVHVTRHRRYIDAFSIVNVEQFAIGYVQQFAGTLLAEHDSMFGESRKEREVEVLLFGVIRGVLRNTSAKIKYIFDVSVLENAAKKKKKTKNHCKYIIYLARPILFEIVFSAFGKRSPPPHSSIFG